MKDYTRVAILISLALLMVTLAFVGPHFNLFDGWRIFDGPTIWILLAVFFFSRSGCCGRRRCGRKPAATETTA